MPDSTAQTPDVPTTDASIGLSETPTVPQASSDDFQPVPPHTHDGLNSPLINKTANGLPSLPMSVANGGTGGTSLAVHGVLVGNGTSAVSVTGTGTSGQVLTSNGASSDPTFQTPGAGTTASTFTAAEALTAGNAVAIGTGNQNDDIVIQTQKNAATAQTCWLAQTFVAPLGGVSKVTINGGNSGGSATTLRCALRAVTAGVIQSIDIAGNNWNGTVSTVSFNADIVFGSLAGGNIGSLTPGATYAFVVKDIVFAGADNMKINYQNTDVYSGGTMYTSTNNGSTWTQNTTQDLYFKIGGIDSVSGQVMKANALGSIDRGNNFIGFAAANAVSGGSVSVNTGGIDSNQSGLTIASTYYLSNTPGGISSSAGTVSRKIGMATAATGLLIKHDNL